MVFKPSFCRSILDIFFALVITFTSKMSAQEFTLPFLPENVYNPAIPSPEQILKFPPGERPVRYQEAIRYFQILAEKSPRMLLMRSGQTYEKRPLYYAVISSEENLARLPEIQKALAKLADPRKIKSSREIEEILQSIPAVAWLMYAIHGDELSSTDAALQVAYQLVAGTDSITQKIRHNLLVMIDPLENPDGRERYLAQMQQWNGNVPNADVQSVQHTGVWPRGRGNHYLFDLNRDWFLLTHPETRARVKAILHWNPQLVVDSHEMGALATYFFPPSREPLHPNISQTIKKWWNQFSADQARAFDHFGWSYFTTEVFDDWYPGYGSSWPYFIGAIGILYEQARTDGSLIKRPEGSLLSFREAIHHHFTSSMANLLTAAKNCKSLLKDFYEMKWDALTIKKRSSPRVYYIVPEKHPTRTRKLIDKLLMQHIEVQEALSEFKVKRLHSYWNLKTISKTLPAGTFIIPTKQPLRPLIEAIMEFDPRLSSEFLQEERRSLLKDKETRMYEVSAWSLPLAYGIEAYWSTEEPSVRTNSLKNLPRDPGRVENTRPGYGFVFDYHNDGAVKALVKFLEAGYRVRCARKPFIMDGRNFSRGSLLLRLNENPETIFQDVEKIAQEAGITILGVNTANTSTGPDLGSGKFRLLVQPHIALIVGAGISTTSLSALWYLLDQELAIRHSLLEHFQLDETDLRKYNVLVLPSLFDEPQKYKMLLGDSGIKKIKSWVENGGTLIGIGKAAAFLADTATGISKVRIRRQALKDLPLYTEAVRLEKRSRQATIDPRKVWEGDHTTVEVFEEASQNKVNLKQLERQDERLRLFQPRGTILHVDLDSEHWLTFGVGNTVPAILYTSYAYFSMDPIQTPARLADAPHLRLSGLLWPEARTRWANTAYATREKMDKGQVILFADDPFFRAYFYGTARLLINALLLGPGMGTEIVVPW